MTLAELFATFTASAFRLEALQDYPLKDDEERRRAFLAGRPLPPKPSKTADMALVREATRAEKRVHRVHVVDLPLSDYLRFELAAYPENIAAGEDVRIADRAAHPGLRELTADFWLFDAETDHPSVVWFTSAPEGVTLSRDYSTGPADIKRARRQRDLALEWSLPLAQFVTLPGAR